MSSFIVFKNNCVCWRDVVGLSYCPPTDNGDAAFIDVTMRGRDETFEIVVAGKQDFNEFCALLQSASANVDEGILELRRKVDELQLAVMYGPGSVQANLAELSFLKRKK